MVVPCPTGQRRVIGPPRLCEGGKPAPWMLDIRRTRDESPLCMGRLSHALMPHTTLGFLQKAFR